MIPLTAEQIAQATGGQLAGVDRDVTVRDVVVDSRSTGSDSMFVAIAGERVDGHDFARQAVAAGAAVVLANRPLRDDEGDIPCIVVDDPVMALGRLAAWVRRELLTCVVIGITGSSGKTTTKDLLVAVLSTVGPTVGARGSFNTEVGVPLTILSADESTQFLVLEMGMRGVGHIAYLVDMAAPSVGVVVNVGSAHIELLGTTDAIAHAKAEIVTGLPRDAVAVLNGDDARVRAMADHTQARVVMVGTSADCDVRATDVRLDSRARPSFTLHYVTQDQSEPVTLAYSGEHYVSNALVAAGAAFAVGASIEQVADGLRAAKQQSKWRMEVREAPNGVVVVNDAYNANPESMSAALRTLVAMAAGRRSWAVLGEMRELGQVSGDRHRDIGRLAADLGVDRLVCVGEATRAIHDAAENVTAWEGESAWVADPDSAVDLLERHLVPGEIVLVKASRSIGLERVAAALLGGDQ